MSQDAISESPVADLDEHVRVPAYVRDLQSFLRWRDSDEFPEQARVSWLGGVLYLKPSPYVDEAVYVPAYVRDLAGFLRWVHSDAFPERGRISWLGGELDIDMSPEEIETHNKVKGDVYGDLRNFVRHEDLGDLLCDGVLLANQAVGLSTEPDLMFCSWESLQSGRVRYVSRGRRGRKRLVEVSGSPDVAVEIVSRASFHKDTLELPEKYFKAEIPEYWLIDARGGAIDFRLHVRGEGEYRLSEPDADGYLFSPVFQASFLLTRELNRVGGYRYTLHHRRA